MSTIIVESRDYRVEHSTIVNRADKWAAFKTPAADTIELEIRDYLAGIRATDITHKVDWE